MNNCMLHVEGDDKPSHSDHSLFSGGRSHQVFTRLVLWPVQAAVLEDQGGELAGHCTSCQRFRVLQ